MRGLEAAETEYRNVRAAFQELSLRLAQDRIDGHPVNVTLSLKVTSLHKRMWALEEECIRLYRSETLGIGR